eukprot:2244639-Pleurochrysis_carterae.AAC.1
MHAVPTTNDVATLQALQLACATCDCRTSVEQRTIRAHMPVDGNLVACDCCAFAHDRAMVEKEQKRSSPGYRHCAMRATPLPARRTLALLSLLTRGSTVGCIQDQQVSHCFQQVLTGGQWICCTSTSTTASWCGIGR